jgi:hypothetical protein
VCCKIIGPVHMINTHTHTHIDTHTHTHIHTHPRRRRHTQTHTHTHTRTHTHAHIHTHTHTHAGGIWIAWCCGSGILWEDSLRRVLEQLWKRGRRTKLKHIPRFSFTFPVFYVLSLTFTCAQTETFSTLC